MHLAPCLGCNHLAPAGSMARPGASMHHGSSLTILHMDTSHMIWHSVTCHTCGIVRHHVAYVYEHQGHTTKPRRRTLTLSWLAGICDDGRTCAGTSQSIDWTEQYGAHVNRVSLSSPPLCCCSTLYSLNACGSPLSSLHAHEGSNRGNNDSSDAVRQRPCMYGTLQPHSNLAAPI